MSAERLTVKRLPASRILCTLTLAEEEARSFEESALRRLAPNVSIKGFRPGSAPKHLLRERIGDDRLFEETVREVLRTELQRIAKEEQLQPVIPPKVEAIARDPLTLSITFIERPQVTIKNIDSLTVTKKDIQADPKEVEKVVQSVLQEYRTTASVDRAAHEQDEVVARFSATDADGNDIPGLRADDYTFVIGSNTLLPGFEEQVKGLKKGEEKTFTLILPEKFADESLRGKPATFHLTVVDVRDVRMPTLTDELAKEKLQSESAAAFRALVEESIKRQEEQFEHMRRERELMEEIKKRVNVELAEELIEEEAMAMAREWEQQLKERGMTPNEALEKQGKTSEQLQKELKEQAVDRWKLRLGMAKIIEERSIDLSEEEIRAGFDAFVGNLPEQQRQEAQQEWTKRGRLYEEIRWRTLVGKATDSLLGA